MSDKKRKIFKFNRPGETKPGDKESSRKLPKVTVTRSAAAKPSDTDKIKVTKPETAKIPKAKAASQPLSVDEAKGATTRISLPDDTKIRKARRATRADDVLPTDEIPSADQLREAAKNATARIMIDTEDVVSSEASTRIPQPKAQKTGDGVEFDTSEVAARSNAGKGGTTKIETDEVVSQVKKSTTRIETGEVIPGKTERTTRIPLGQVARMSKDTTRIDTDEVRRAASTTRIDTDEVKKVVSGKPTEDSEQTMEIDPVGDLSDKTLEVAQVTTQEIEKIRSPLAEDADQTLEVTPVGTQNLEQSLQEASLDTGGPDASDQTMRIDSEALQTGSIEKVKSTDLEQALKDAGMDKGKPADAADQTMRIDSEALQTGAINKIGTTDLEQALQEALQDKGQPADTADQTMRIDSDALQTGAVNKVGTTDLEQALKEADQDKGKPADAADQTMRIDSEALQTGAINQVGATDLEQALKEAGQDKGQSADTADQTMRIDSDALQTGSVDKVKTSDLGDALEAAEEKPAASAPEAPAKSAGTPGTRVRRVVAPKLTPPAAPNIRKISISRKPSTSAAEQKPAETEAKEETKAPAASADVQIPKKPQAEDSKFHADTVPLESMQLELEQELAETDAPKPDETPAAATEASEAATTPPAEAPVPAEEPPVEEPAAAAAADSESDEQSDLTPVDPSVRDAAFKAATLALDPEEIMRESQEEGIRPPTGKITRLTAKGNERTMEMTQEEIQKALEQNSGEEPEKPEVTRGEKPVRKIEVKKPDAQKDKEQAPAVGIRQAPDKPESIDIQTQEAAKAEEEPAGILSLDSDTTGESGKPDEGAAFSAMTMAMDPAELEKGLQEDDEAKGDKKTSEPRTVKLPSMASEKLDKTMDMSKERPKTIMIKRPGKEPSSPRTVKTVRPDAATVRTARPVAKGSMSEEQKAGTSRVDVPEEASSEGKTVKLRRPGGAPGLKAKAPVSRVAENAGLSVNEDGSVRSTKVTPAIGAGWTVVTILTFLVTVGALWVVLAIQQPDLPMAGRLVDAQNQILNR